MSLLQPDARTSLVHRIEVEPGGIKLTPTAAHLELLPAPTVAGLVPSGAWSFRTPGPAQQIRVSRHFVRPHSSTSGSLRSQSFRVPADRAHDRRASIRLPKFPVHLVHREFLRVELSADPYHHIIVILVLRVTDCFKELCITEDAAHVLGRTCSLTLDAPRIVDIRLWLQRLLKNDLMVPGVLEVVLVGEPDWPSHLGDLAHHDLILVMFFHVPVPIFGIWWSIVLAPDNELVQVAILPAHRHLKDFVELAERAIRHLNPSPDRRIAVLERHLELIDSTGTVNRLTFPHQVLCLQVIQEVVDLVENGVQPLPVSRRGIGERGAYLLCHLLQFFLGKLDELMIGGCLLDPGLHPNRKAGGMDQRFPLLYGQLERELFVWLRPLLGWHDCYSISRSRHFFGGPVGSILTTLIQATSSLNGPARTVQSSRGVFTGYHVTTPDRQHDGHAPCFNMLHSPLTMAE